MKKDFTVILVDSTSHALRIEKLLAQVGIETKLVPVPRHLSSDCGVCVRVDREKAQQVKELLIENSAAFSSIEDVQW
ncbi:MAG TPA: DUF3343 domain-containing protein [Anaerolineales bacterium]|nr:DUF3343 domain-containing protein [Anaerolineales bacterium]